MPLGVVAVRRTPAPPRANPLLALRARVTLLPERAASVTGTLLRPLFRWPVVVAVRQRPRPGLLAVRHSRVAPGFRQVLNDPVDLLAVAGLTIVSAMFHECGHATGCRYGGARPGRSASASTWSGRRSSPMSPTPTAFRAGRLRTDLGGLYFNAGLHAGARRPLRGHLSQILLLVIAVTHLEMLEQLLPFVRFDGYYILSPTWSGCPTCSPASPHPAQLHIPWRPGPARDRPAPRRPDRGHRLGGVRPPAADPRHPRVPPASLPPRSTGRCGSPQPAGPPHNRGPHRTPLRRCHRRLRRRRPADPPLAGSLYVAAGLARRGPPRACAGPLATPPAASRPPLWLPGSASRCSPPSGPSKASSAAGKPGPA